MLIANLHIVSQDVYINAQMVFIMLNDELLGLFMVISPVYLGQIQKYICYNNKLKI